MRNIEIFSGSGCAHCDAAKSLLKKHNLRSEIQSIGFSPGRRSFRSGHCIVVVVITPYIVCRPTLDSGITRYFKRGRRNCTRCIFYWYCLFDIFQNSGGCRSNQYCLSYLTVACQRDITRLVIPE